MKRNNHGFTLIEVLTAIAIVCILITISVVATLQARMKSRDSRRISDATTIMNALESYYATNQSYPTMITPGQPIMIGGQQVLKEVPANPFPRTDGGCADTGYVYTTTSTGYKLTFCLGADHGRFSKGIVVCKNGNCGVKDNCEGEITDAEGIRYPIVLIGDQCWMATHLRTKRKPDATCIVNMHPNLEYTVNPATCTVRWSNSYWPGWPLNNKDFGGYGCFPYTCFPGSRRDCIKSIGPIIPLGTPDPDPNWNQINQTGWQNRGNDVTFAYDYPPTHEPMPGVFSDCNYRGALYSWAGAMNLPDFPPGSLTDCATRSCAGQITTPHRGICPVGWHIPTDQEFHALESTLANGACDPNRNSQALGSDSCAQAGLRLKEGGDSGFNAVLLGVREEFTGMDFKGIDQRASFWTTTEVGPGTAIARSINTGVNGTYRSSDDKAFAYSVRCIRDF